MILRKVWRRPESKDEYKGIATREATKTWLLGLREGVGNREPCLKIKNQYFYHMNYSVMFSNL